MAEAQPFSSCMSTLLRVMSANNTAKGERGDQGGEVPAPAPAHPVPPPPALPGCPPHSPGWTFTRILGPVGSVARGEAEVLPRHLGASLATARGEARDTLPCSCRSPFGLAGMLPEPRGHLWRQVRGCSCPEAAGQAGEGMQGALRHRAQGPEQQRPAMPAAGHGELWRRGLESGD